MHKLITPFMMAICFFVAGCFGEPTPFAELEQRDGKFYKIGSPDPFTGVSAQKVGDGYNAISNTFSSQPDLGEQSNLKNSSREMVNSMLQSKGSSFLNLVEDLGDFRAIENFKKDDKVTETRTIHRTYVDGVLTGPYLELYRNGSVKIRGQLERGQFHGEFYLYQHVNYGDRSWEQTINERDYWGTYTLELMEFKSGKPHGRYYAFESSSNDWGFSYASYDNNGKISKSDYYSRDWYKEVNLENGLIVGDVLLAQDWYNEKRERDLGSSSSMSASQKKALRKLAEDLYDKCQIYGKSYDSRC